MRTRLPILKCIKSVSQEKDVRLIDRDVEGDENLYEYEIDVHLEIEKVLSKNVTGVSVEIERNTSSLSKKIIQDSVLKDDSAKSVGFVSNAKTIASLSESGNSDDPEKKYTGYLLLDGESLSMTSRIAQTLATAISEANTCFFNKKSTQKANQITADRKDPITYVKKELKDYALGKSSFSSKGSSPTRRTGLIGKIKNNKKIVKDISSVLSDEMETVLMSVSDILNDQKIDRGNENIVENVIQMNDTVLVEGIQGLKSIKQSTQQRKEYELDGKGRLVKTKIPSSKKIGKNPGFSSLQAQIERGEKSNIEPILKSLKGATWSTINTLQKTPATIIQESIKSPIVTSSENFLGIISNSQKLLATSEAQASYASIINRMFSSSSKNRKNILNISKNSFQAVQVRKKYKNCKVPFRLTVQDSDIPEGKFIIRIRAFNKFGQIIDSKKVTFNHSEAIQNFYTTSVPPIFSGKIDETGNVILSVKQADKDADKLTIYRKYISSETFDEGQEFEMFKSFNGNKASEKSKIQTIIDNTEKIDASIVIYRAVSHTSSGGGSGAFKDIVIDLSKGASINTRGTKNLTTSSIITMIVKKGILIKVSNFSGDYTVGHLEKTRQEDGFKKREILLDDDGNPVIVKPGLQYLDKDVNHGVLYKYCVVYHTFDGLEKRTNPVKQQYRFIFGDSDLDVSANNTSVANSPAKKAVSLSTHIGSIKKEEEDVASAEASKRFSKNAQDLQKSQLGAQQVAKKTLAESRKTQKTRNNGDDTLLLKDYGRYFLEEEVSQKIIEKDVVAIEVKRIDGQSSEKIDVGTFMPGETFDDSDDIIPGRKYTYEFQEVRMDMATYKDVVEKMESLSLSKEFKDKMLPSIPKNGNELNSSDLQNFESKFLQPSAVIDGTVRSIDTMVKSADSVLSLSKVGEPYQIEVQIPRKKSQIISSSVKGTKSKRSVIEWSIKSGMSKSKSQKYKSDIDYFVIEYTVFGQTQPAIVCHGTSIDSGNFRSVHQLDNNFLGEVTYFITPVYNDCTIGEKVLVGKVLIE